MFSFAEVTCSGEASALQAQDTVQGESPNSAAHRLGPAGDYRYPMSHFCRGPWNHGSAVRAALANRPESPPPFNPQNSAL